MNDPMPVSSEILRTRDLVGWEVVDREGEKVGTVADLLFDRMGRVRMVHAEFGFPRKHVLLPQHQLEWGDRRFILGSWTRDQVRSLPPYAPELPLDPPLVEEMTRAFPWFYDPEPGPWSEPPGSAETRIVPIAEAKEFRLETGAPDPRGWNVFGADGERVGTVSQLLVDPAALKVRYLDVDLLDDLFHLRDDRHVLIPLEHVELKARGNDAWVDRLGAADVARLPAYPGGAVEGWMQRVVARAFE